MSSKGLAFVTFCAVLSTPFLSRPAFAVQAQPVPVPEDQGLAPQVDIAGTGIATFAGSKNSDHPKAESDVDFSDSALEIGAAQRLYEGAIGSFGFGGLTTDESNRGTGSPFFLYQAFTDIQTEHFEAVIGRSDNPTAHLIDFPTLRGDDLITLTNSLDPYSNGANIEEHRYSNVASVTFNQDLKYFENIHAQHLINSAGVGTQSGVNSFGFTIESMSTPGLEEFPRIPFWGFGYEHISLDANSPGGLHQAYAGAVVNLNESVTDRVDFRLQDIVSVGSDLTGFSTVTDTYQADSNQIAGSLRYLHAPFGMPGYQLALTGAAKSYFKTSGSSVGGALSAVRQLGDGFDLVAQYKGQWRNGALALAQSSGIAYEQVGEVGLIYTFDATINPHISPRRSILNQQHQYVPY